MASSTYESALELAGALSAEERLRLIQALLGHSASHGQESKQSSVLELRGLGAEIWQGSDAQEYVRRERSSWSG